MSSGHLRDTLPGMTTRKKAAKRAAETPAEDPPVVGTPDERADAAQRAQLCNEGIAAVLKQFNCAIIPRIELNDIEPVGRNGDAVQVRASFAILPYAAS